MTAQQQSTINFNIGRLSGMIESLEISENIPPKQLAGILRRVQQDLENVVAGIPIVLDEPKQIPAKTTAKPQWTFTAGSTKPLPLKPGRDIHVPTTAPADKDGDLDEKAKKRAYANAYYHKNREKILAQQQAAEQEKKARKILKNPGVSPYGGTARTTMPVSPPVADPPVNSPKGFIPGVKSEHQKQVEARAIKAEEDFQAKILVCDCPLKEKIVKGCEIPYKGKIFFKDRCIEWYENEGRKQEHGIPVLPPDNLIEDDL